jgi:hypothetical protein
VPENVSIAYRGANFAIGQGPQFYGIWHAAAPQAAPIEWWPLTPDGWSGAWMRFASIEVPGTIAPVTQQPVTQQPATRQSGEQAVAAGSVAGVPEATVPTAAATVAQPTVAEGAASLPGAGLPAAAVPTAAPRSRTLDPATVTRTSWVAVAILGVGVVLGVASLFPAYVAGASLASQSSNLVPHVIYLAAWSVSAVLIVLGGTRLRVGALFGLGVSAVTLGLFFADLGTPLASGAHLAGTGLLLGIFGWLACTSGVGLALWAGLTGQTSVAGNGAVRRRGLARHLGRASGHEIVPLVTLVLAAVGTAIAFAPSWDKFTLQTASGVSQVITEGNAFANPGPVILGNVLVMAALVAVVIVAALWRPMRLGAALAVGAIVPMVAEAISAIVQIHEPTSPLQFGISQAQASQVGLSISAGLTPMFWVFCAFVATMILLCAWMLLAHESAAPQQASPYQVGPYAAAPSAVAGAAGVGGAASVEGAADYSDAAGLPRDSQ